MQIAEYIAVLDADGVRLAEAARRAGLDAPLHTTPGWRIRDLLLHISGVHRWATSYVTTGYHRHYSRQEEGQFFLDVDDDRLLDWFRDGHEALVAALRAADPELTCWTFLPAASPLAFWARRQAHETAVHRTDAESALGTVPSWPPGFAADGIDELLGGFFSRPIGRLVADPARSMALVATDTDRAWTFHIEPNRRRLVAGEHPADLRISGTVNDLYLLLWNRLSQDRVGVGQDRIGVGQDRIGRDRLGRDRVELRGDPAVLALWRERAHVTWS